MDIDVHKQVLLNGDKKTGCTIHYVNEDDDQGPILVQKECDVLPDRQSLAPRPPLLEIGSKGWGREGGRELKRRPRECKRGQDEAKDAPRGGQERFDAPAGSQEQGSAARGLLCGALVKLHILRKA